MLSREIFVLHSCRFALRRDDHILQILRKRWLTTGSTRKLLQFTLNNFFKLPSIGSNAIDDGIHDAILLRKKRRQKMHGCHLRITGLHRHLLGSL